MSVKNYFCKNFKFKGEDWEFPAEDLFFSSSSTKKHEGLQIIKSILNHVKSKLNDYQIEEWSRHTRNRNPAQQILHHLKNGIRGEFVTQAFAKFFECISAYPMVCNFENVFQSVHLCEAPGAFIAALNHFLKLHHPEAEVSEEVKIVSYKPYLIFVLFKFRWRASTLNPYFEGNSISNTILDDRLIAHTLENWVFGEDYDGDILKESNILSLITYCKSLGAVNLVTGDGSIDCLDQPENQEEFVSKLHLAEFIVSLAILADDGSMLIKMFTFYETTSIAMLYILNCCFRELHIFKPATSKEGNSEVYVIGIGFKKSKITDGIIEKMISNFKDESKTLLELDAIPAGFQQEVVEAARFFMNQQVSVIEGNIRTFKKYDKLENDRIKLMKQQIVEEYVKQYDVGPITEEQKLLHGLHVSNDINLNVRVHSGSHSERITFFNLSRCDQFQVFFDRLRHFYESIFENALNSLCVAQKFCNLEVSSRDFCKPIQGRHIGKVVSSKFILLTLVKYLIELRTFLEETLDPDEVYIGKKVSVCGNHLVIDMEYFRRASSYDTYEKDVTMKLLSFLLTHEEDVFIIEGLPLFTQFIVGVILYLALFVFEEVHLKRSSGNISFKSLRVDGKENLKSLIDLLNQQDSSSKALLGICDTKMLFSFSQEFYKSVIDYNNHLCLRFCSFYLNLSSN